MKMEFLWIVCIVILVICLGLFTACDKGPVKDPEEENKSYPNGISQSAGEKLATPSNLKITEEVLTWNAVKNADYYDVYIDGVYEDTVLKNRFTLKRSKKGTYSVSVCAASLGYQYQTSAKSAAIPFNVGKTALDTPVIRISDKTVSWNAIEGATGYDIFVDGEKHASVTKPSYQVDITAQGTYPITVKAISTNADYHSQSELSNTVKYLNLDKTVYLDVKEQIPYTSEKRVTVAPESWCLSQDTLKGGQVLKVGLFFTVDSQLSNNDGSKAGIEFVPQLLRADNTVQAGGTFQYINYLGVYDKLHQKVLVVYVMQLPEDFKTGDQLQIRFTFNKGLQYTVDQLKITGAGYDFSKESDYTLFHERDDIIKSGLLTLRADGEYESSKMEQLNSIVFLDSKETVRMKGPKGFIESRNQIRKQAGQSMNIGTGQVLKYGFFLDVKELSGSGENPAFRINNTIWRTSTNLHMGYASYTVPFKSLKEGKILVIVVAEVNENYPVDDMFLNWRIEQTYAGITYHINRVVIAGADYDFGKICEDYEIVLEEVSDDEETTPTKPWTPSTYKK